uniref:CMP-N-acetylneuraminate-beta-galactosamide-alpha-2,3-sialyltransferase 1-like n=1 Tax=Hippocampus comes TaxID=109280 RepID=A0A3Q2Z5U2_HIPCM
MDASPKPFLSIPSPTSEDDFNWWKVGEHLIPAFLPPIAFRSRQSRVDRVQPRSLLHTSGYFGNCVTWTDTKTGLRTLWLKTCSFVSSCHFFSFVDVLSISIFQNLQLEQRPFRFFNETVDKLLAIFPSSPPLERRSPDRCRTCAVVGNSGNLKGSRYGPLIDQHSIVIRMNRGHTKGYESDVGTKTTHHVMYPESAIHLDNSTRLVFFPFKINDLLWLLKNFRTCASSRTLSDLRQVMIINPGFMKYAHEMWLKKRGRYPSTGFMTVVLSLQICDEVGLSIFGFGADRDGNWSHYFEILRNKKLRTGPHPGAQEYDVIRELNQKQIVRFFQGL